MKRLTLTALLGFALITALAPATSPQRVFRPDCELPIRNTRTAGVRFRGRLMLDAGHRPCGDSGKKKSDMKRRSLWEIHSVYSIDVCRNTSLGGCRDESTWTPFVERAESVAAVSRDPGVNDFYVFASLS